MTEKLALLETEGRNPRTMDLDQLPTAELVERMHQENLSAFTAVEKVLPQVTQVVDVIVERLGRGGRLFYVGAGTSGRLGVLDASECPPTFGVSKELIQGLIAGGDFALRNSIEGAEDDADIGARDLSGRNITAKDVVVGIAASGRTPYVIGALDAARAAGAFPVAIANVSNSALAQHADITIEAVTGPEVVTGSTRLKAGTAQKLILNLLTTAAMVRLGKVYSNLMVDVRASNVKLRDRAVRILISATDAERPEAEAALEAADGQVKTAIVMLQRKVSAVEADRLLAAADGWVGKIV
ncbi:MAG: N-acetylmuramic acid 6-phosphate etherase [Chthonomonadaceae bacterium]|nr:N-acetylmuramic acid 6-phosphate etherase [Chthonomonadaceae bacterium]